jgi:regulator of protease activity HflC (stomatin/prohibitin superfamily)
MNDEDTSTPEDADRRDRLSGRAVHPLLLAIRRAFGSLWEGVVVTPARWAGRALGGAATTAPTLVARWRRPVIVCAVAGAAGWGLWTHPPVASVARGDVGIRTNRLTGGATAVAAGPVIVWPGLHQLRVFPLRDQSWRAADGTRSDGASPFQSAEGLSIGVDVTVRYAIDPARLVATSAGLPDDVGGQLVAPEVQAIVYRTFPKFTVREIFATKRAEIQVAIEGELRPKLAADGLVLRAVQIGRVDLPADYKHGMESLLAEELESEKMRFTLELKDKRVKESALDAEAEKVKREKAAEAAGSEQIIAARAQEEAMKHVLPFKQKQIEQRQLEAEADKQSRIRTAEGSAQARRIEAAGEADSRQKLADAEVYRLERVGKVTSDQMARDGGLVTRHPLLIQKTLADKLSDKIQVIIAPPPADGGFIASALVGAGRGTAAKADGGVTATADAGSGNGQANASKDPQ